MWCNASMCMVPRALFFEELGAWSSPVPPSITSQLALPSPSALAAGREGGPACPFAPARQFARTSRTIQPSSYIKGGPDWYGVCLSLGACLSSRPISNFRESFILVVSGD